MLNIGGFNALLGSRLYVPQMPNSDVLKGWEKDVNFGSEESVNFSLTLELSSELRCCNLGVRIEDLCLSSARWYLTLVVIHVRRVWKVGVLVRGSCS